GAAMAAGAVDRQHRTLHRGAAFRPAGGRPLRIGVDDDGLATRQRGLRRQMGCDRGLADTALGTGHQHGLHPLPPPWERAASVHRWRDGGERPCVAIAGDRAAFTGSLLAPARAPFARACRRGAAATGRAGPAIVTRPSPTFVVHERPAGPRGADPRRYALDRGRNIRRDARGGAVPAI